jgi:hypothetical protein
MTKQNLKIITKTGWNSDISLWRPEAYFNNRIRIVPVPRKSKKANWWMRVNFHYIKVSEGRRFICNNQLFKKPCKLCDLRLQFIFNHRCEEAEKIDTWKYVFLNVIDREYEDKGVKVWMAPISVWNQIKKEALSRGDSSLIFDSPDDGTYGCDLSVYYSPDSTQYNLRYKVSILQDDPRPLGTEKQEGIWAEQVLPLEPENFFSPIDDEEVEYLKEEIEKAVFIEWCARTKKLLEEIIKWSPGIGCRISSDTRREGLQLLESLDRGENIEPELSKFLAEFELEKTELLQLDEELHKILETDGFKKGENDHENFLYVSARRTLGWEGIARYKKELEEHGGHKGYDLLVRVKSKFPKHYDEEEKEWLLNQEYEYLMKYGVITDRRSSLVSAEPEVRAEARSKARDDVRAKANAE